jgi:hypothetical protein
MSAEGVERFGKIIDSKIFFWGEQAVGGNFPNSVNSFQKASRG